MEKQTLSNYGWIVIVTLVLAVMLALATPFGTYVGDGVVSIANGFVGASDNAIDDDNIANLGQKWDEKLNPKSPKELIASGIVPEGATYTSADGTVYNAGDTMPTVQPLDAFRYGDYTYVYSADYGAEPYTQPFENQFYNTNYNGWLVTIRQETSDGEYYGYQLKKSSYGKILSNINGVDVTDMSYTFWNCTKLTTAPVIPNSVTTMSSTFSGCTALTTAPVIPSSVTSMGATFNYCISLTTAPVIPNSVTTMSSTFSECKNLTTAPIIPSSVTTMYHTFQSCTALTTAPTIPSSVKDMQYTFNGCTALTGNIEINANPTSYVMCFNSTTQPIKIIGSCGNKAALAATSSNGNISY